MGYRGCPRRKRMGQMMVLRCYLDSACASRWSHRREGFQLSDWKHMLSVYFLYDSTHRHLVRSETRSSYVSEVEAAKGLMPVARWATVTLRGGRVNFTLRLESLRSANTSQDTMSLYSPGQGSLLLQLRGMCHLLSGQINGRFFPIFHKWTRTEL